MKFGIWESVYAAEARPVPRVEILTKLTMSTSLLRSAKLVCRDVDTMKIAEQQPYSQVRGPNSALMASNFNTIFFNCCPQLVST